jgi:hypothetical protein
VLRRSQNGNARQLPAPKNSIATGRRWKTAKVMFFNDSISDSFIEDFHRILATRIKDNVASRKNQLLLSSR